MNKKVLYTIIAIVILVLGGTLFLRRSEQKGKIQEVSGVEAPQNPNIKEFTVNGSNFQFVPNQITINKGDTVKITFKDDDGTHNLVIDGYGVTTHIIQGGSEDSIQFVADKIGNFEYYCSIGSHRDLGMKGILTVE